MRTRTDKMVEISFAKLVKFSELSVTKVDREIALIATHDSRDLLGNVCASNDCRAVNEKATEDTNVHEEYVFADSLNIPAALHFLLYRIDIAPVDALRRFFDRVEEIITRTR